METVYAAIFLMFDIIFIAQVSLGKNSCNILETDISSGNVLFTGVGNAQGFLVNEVVFSVTVVTNGFIKGVHFSKMICQTRSM